MADKNLDQWIADQAKQNDVNLDDEATCEELQVALEALQESLQDAPPDRKSGIIKAINRILRQMEKQGC